MLHDIDRVCARCERTYVPNPRNPPEACPWCDAPPLSYDELCLQAEAQLRGGASRAQRDRDDLQRMAATDEARTFARAPVQKTRAQACAEEEARVKVEVQAYMLEQSRLKTRAVKTATQVQSRETQQLQALAHLYATARRRRHLREEA